MTNLQEPHYFTEEAVREWTRIAEKHRLRDEQFLRKLERWFCPGPILELGAATGHLSSILQCRGFDVAASDISPRFVAACEARGLTAQIVDATADIYAQTRRHFSNVLAQNVIPLVRRDRGAVTSALGAIHSVLERSGRLIWINARTRRAIGPQNFYTPHELVEIGRSSGMFTVVAVIPHQVVPTSLYRQWNARVLNVLDFHATQIGSIRIVSVMQKID